jgi:putative transposase
MYRASTPRERERRHALWLALQGWPTAQVADALGRDPHAVGSWLAAFRRAGRSRWPSRTPVAPPALNPAQQAALKEAVQRPPREVGIEQANWHWKVVRRFVSERFGLTLARSACRNYLRRQGFVVKRPVKRLLKADGAKRAAFVADYACLRTQARTSGAKHFFVDEAHFYADVDPHGMWVLKGTPAVVNSTSPRYGEKASYYSAVCLEMGEVEARPLEGNSSAETSVAFLGQLRARHREPLRAYLRLRLVRLPAYSPDFNADEHLWAWVREEVTANTCFGTAAKVRAALDPFFTGLAARKDEVTRRCRTELQSRADAWDTAQTGPLSQDGRKVA